MALLVETFDDFCQKSQQKRFASEWGVCRCWRRAPAGGLESLTSDLEEGEGSRLPRSVDGCWVTCPSHSHLHNRMRPKDVGGLPLPVAHDRVLPISSLTLASSHRGNKDPALVLVSDWVTEKQGNIFSFQLMLAVMLSFRADGIHSFYFSFEIKPKSFLSLLGKNNL